jgi:hypothetical protein
MKKEKGGKKIKMGKSLREKPEGQWIGGMLNSRLDPVPNACM